LIGGFGVSLLYNCSSTNQNHKNSALRAYQSSAEKYKDFEQDLLCLD
jgi:hypothetical protein